jgi:hypothetical protein
VTGVAGRVPVSGSVRVTRAGHPLRGLELVAWGQLRRRGQLELVLVLPDGSKKQIPASWTDLGTASGSGTRETGDLTGVVVTADGVLAPVGDLLHVREVISQLVARTDGVPQQAARQSPAKEDDRAAHPTQSAAGPSSGATLGSGKPTPRTAEDGSGPDPRPAHRPSGPGNPDPDPDGGHPDAGHRRRGHVDPGDGEPR